jgi:RNA polymerase sigma factor (sigma-70 family)
MGGSSYERGGGGIFPPFQPLRIGSLLRLERFVTHEIDLEAIVGRFYASLYRFALSLTKNEAEAGDLTQQTFFILAQRSHQIRDTSKVKCWLFTTLRREFLRALRIQSSHPHVEFRPEIHDGPSLSTDALRALDAKAVIDALSEIEPTYRTAVELFYLSELSYKEIAQTLDIPIGTVMSRLSRGKEQLKAILAAAISENSDKIIPLNKDEDAAH